MAPLGCLYGFGLMVFGFFIIHAYGLRYLLPGLNSSKTSRFVIPCLFKLAKSRFLESGIEFTISTYPKIFPDLLFMSPISQRTFVSRDLISQVFPRTVSYLSTVRVLSTPAFSEIICVEYSNSRKEFKCFRNAPLPPPAGVRQPPLTLTGGF